MTKGIEQRKRDHLKLAQQETLNFSISAGFERWRFVHNALPELNLSEVDTSTSFLDKPLEFPLLISSMSGGVAESLQFNATLAAASEQVGCALGLGSIRAALEEESARESFMITRQKAPNAVIMANLGIAQVLQSDLSEKAAKFCQDLEADAMIIHLNPLQEAIQPEGETNFKGALHAIGRWVQEFPFPIIVKEVGQGLVPDVISQLQDVGVEIIDVAGAGGSNWISIERERLGPQEELMRRVALEFSEWGVPTAQILEKLDTEMFVIASGGLKHPLDLAKSLCLGAQLGGVAGAILKKALEEDEAALIEELLVWKRSLTLAMFGLGIGTLEDLIGNRRHLTKID